MEHLTFFVATYFFLLLPIINIQVSLQGHGLPLVNAGFCRGTIKPHFFLIGTPDNFVFSKAPYCDSTLLLLHPIHPPKHYPTIL